MGPRKLRIFLVDDHTLLREGLKAMINQEVDMEVVGESDSGEYTARQIPLMAPEHRPDIVVMDLSLPGMNGAQATQKLKQSCPNLRVLALSMHEDTTYLRAVLEADASGYILKRSAPHELVQALRGVAAGGIYLDPALAGKLTSDFVRQGSSRLTPPRESDLSERESEVLRLIALGYSGKETAQKLGVSQKTVESYKLRALEKTGLGTRVDIVRYAAQKGWLHDL